MEVVMVRQVQYTRKLNFLYLTRQALHASSLPAVRFLSFFLFAKVWINFTFILVLGNRQVEAQLIAPYLRQKTERIAFTSAQRPAMGSPQCYIQLNNTIAANNWKTCGGKINTATP
jgi:hypothetical protein